MRLAEYDGKVLLRRHGVAIPRGVLLRAGEEPPENTSGGFFLKAQVLEGGRGKSGLVRRLQNVSDIRAARRLILATLDDADTPLLLEQAVPAAQEIFLSLRIDGTRQCLELLLAPEGGENVEQSKRLARVSLAACSAAVAEQIFPAAAEVFPRPLAARLSRYAARLADITRAEDLQLLEINPLVLTQDGGLVACDAKIIRDDAADFRHDGTEFALSRMLAERGMTAAERAARDLGFQLVETDGDVVLVTSGAGLAMMMMDLLADHGLRAASFMDNLQGAPDETMTERLKIARMLAGRPNIRAIVFQTVIASRSLAERIEALVGFIEAEPLPKPLFVGLAAGHAATRKMSAEAAIERLRALGVAAFTDPIALVQAAAAAVGAA